jgi:hypothetical protein
MGADFPVVRGVERVMGIEPTYSAWEAEVLPLNYTRTIDFHAMKIILLFITL